MSFNCTARVKKDEAEVMSCFARQETVIAADFLH